MTHRRDFLLGSTLSVLTASWASAQSEAYPNRPIRFIYTYGPGGPGDALARLLGTQMSPLLGQPIVVENRTGASGSVGLMAGAKSAADGHTFVITTATTVVHAPFVTRNKAFDPLTSVLPVANVASQPQALVAHPSVPASDFPSLVEWARNQPGGVDVAIAGVAPEVGLAMIAKQTGVNLVRVPYRGAAAGLQAVMGGEVKLLFVAPPPSVNDLAKQGRVKLIAVSSAEASPLLPGVQPIGKHVPGFVQDINYAIWAPPETPAHIVAKVSEIIQRIASTSSFSEQLQAMGLTAAPSSASSLHKLMQNEVVTLQRAMELITIKYD
ncbi:Bug family tripartite tricarboxylate transporter substrate binding protein [Hydrogenophaga laconesensis]|uniref:Tripartite-type tricarboxylate transporter receptor subunit TctC n=1 Tax=Hydrogenophaga laconesensis TaxID=1805971 RepID=A0ABU1VJF4_9BURK|nr:tripartite tricarboxylate transporter substrate binding protein [Hydrogenophaga laconesensis]MDR7097445.1 tripartite-type tricarboxylate transporter receptor subunit TctC [Hydrogenophaga laconesensis]